MEGSFSVGISSSRIEHAQFSPVNNVSHTVNEYHVENHIYVNAYFHQQHSQPSEPDVSRLSGFTGLAISRSNTPGPRYSSPVNRPELPSRARISPPPSSQIGPALPSRPRPRGRQSLPVLPLSNHVTTEGPAERPHRRNCQKVSTLIPPSGARPQRVFPVSGFSNNIHSSMQRRNCSSAKNNGSANNESATEEAKQRATNYTLTEVQQSRRVSNDSGLSPRLLAWDKSCNLFQSCDMVWKKWEKFATLPENLRKRHFTTVALGVSIYVLFGDQTVMRLVGNQWIRMDRMKFDHGQRPPAVEFNGEIYAIGSCNGKQVTTSVERFNPRLNRWVQTAPMLHRKCDHAVVSADNYVYCIGGKGHRLVEKLNPLSGRWTSVAPMNTCRNSFAAAFYQNKIYAIGGDQNCVVGKSLQTEVEVYDVASNVWTNIVPLHIPRGRCKAHVIGKSLFVIGGDSISYHDKDKTIERLELTSKTQAWTMISLPRDMDIDSMTVTVMQVPS